MKYNWKRRSIKMVLAAVTAVTVASAGMWSDSQTAAAVPSPGVTAAAETSASPALDASSAGPARKAAKKKKTAKRKKAAAKAASSAGITTPEVTFTPSPSAIAGTKQPAPGRKQTKKTSDLGLTKQQTNIAIWCIVILAIGSISGITLTVTKKKNR